MCLAIPGRVRAIVAVDPALPVATVDFWPFVRTVQLLYVPETKVGDYVIVQAGFAIRRVSEAEAEESIRAARELAASGPEPA